MNEQVTPLQAAQNGMPFRCDVCSSITRFFKCESNPQHGSEFYCEKCHRSFPLDNRPRVEKGMYESQLTVVQHINKEN
jgi:transposase-like protein